MIGMAGADCNMNEDEAGRHERGGDDPRGSGGPPRRAPGELSGLVQDVLRQARQPLTADQVLDELTAKGTGPLAYTTVVTILTRLHAHGAADRIKTGRAYAYQAVTDPARRTALRMHRMLDAEHDRAAVLAQFVGDLDARDEMVIRGLLGGDLAPDAGRQDNSRKPSQ
jgi:predicted transcriptional regulator